MDGFEKGSSGRLALAFHVVDLAADHAADGAGGGGEFFDQAGLDGVIGMGEFAEDFKGQGEERVPGKDGHGIAEDDVVGGAAPPEIVVIESGQIVMNQRISVNKRPVRLV